MVEAGARYVAARHEAGAATMADAYARMSAGVATVSVHQGCGLTNALTGIAEAAKSRTPLVVVAAEASTPRSNFAVDQTALATAVGAVPMRITSAGAASAQAAVAVATAVHERRVVLLNAPLDVQTHDTRDLPAPNMPAAPPVAAADPVDVERLARALAAARRPGFVAGRGARGAGCRRGLGGPARRCGALLRAPAGGRGAVSRH